MNRLHLAIFALVSCATLPPCQADAPASALHSPPKSALVTAAPPVSKAGAAALNPQPLPPGPPDPERARATGNSPAAKAGIIIVGGAPARKPGARLNRQSLNPQPLPPGPPDPEQVPTNAKKPAAKN
jgi:hypothetical protein